VGSESFGQWDAVELNSENNQSILIEEGLGHAFLSLADNTVVNYLCSEPFNPSGEHGINPLDESISIPFGTWLQGQDFIVSPKDSEAPSFAEAQTLGLLPRL
jgi:dTDP-4-dehydrorhamnose 3,5-epimerase